ncbi:unnamed protein product [Meganyctiphanes norvegica]|uniref:Ras-GAP domain-containing protein n=1 Tax=Meganyctiphanes norvegica TaxID=48144 RepID=A0AAV2QBW0_MEGNR
MYNQLHAPIMVNQAMISKCLDDLNQSLVSGTPSSTLEALKALPLASQLPPLIDIAASLYHEEMGANRADAGEDLGLKDVKSGVQFLNAISRVNRSIDTYEAKDIWKYLAAPNVHLQGVEENNSQEYHTVMTAMKQQKIASRDPCLFLTYFDLQTLIDEVNAKMQEANSKVGVLMNVNKCVSEGDIPGIMAALSHKALELSREPSQHDAVHYYQLFKILHSAKREMLGEKAAELWLEDIQEVVDAVARNAKEAMQIAQILSQINKNASNRDDKALYNTLKNPILAFLKLQRSYLSQTVEQLLKIQQERASKASKPFSYWITYEVSDTSKVFLNLEDGTYQWSTPSNFNTKTEYLTFVDVGESEAFVIRQAHHDQTVENMVVRLQAVCRGKLLRQKLKSYNTAAVKIQAWWRMIRQKKMYVMYRQALKMWEPRIIVLQRAVRAWLHRRRLKLLTKYFAKHENYVIVLQRAWRVHRARQDLQALTQCQNPPLSIIRKFLHLLDVSDIDFEEVNRLQRLKNEMVQTIRRTHQMEDQVDGLDVKIGLLVHNRINLQELLPVDKENMNPNISGNTLGKGKNSTMRKSKRGSKENIKVGTIRSQKGLKALTKESREKLINYQHLFYLLQTQPHYLATLIFAIPPGKTTKFIENVIFTLYNYGANDRDNYLLLKLFKTALEEEIRSKVLRMSDIASGNPLVVKMIVAFNRKGHGQAALRDMLGPLINKVMEDKNMHIHTNPIDIYKSWVNQMEMQSGQASGLPYVVTQEQALQYPEVQERLKQAINTLKEITSSFCVKITNSRHMIPYAMLFMAKVMRSALQNRFPHIAEKEILKVVGNLVYYRYINSAIVAPDAFDIVNVSPDQKLSNNQRRNLASIAKILQFAASKKGFGEEACHLTCLNPFIVECHEKFKDFFRQCCEVEDPETVYNVTQYSEATLISKPTVYITHQEIVETHQLLLDHEEILAPDCNDTLHTLLSCLGDRPSVESLTPENGNSSGHTEICLALTNKFEVPENTEEKESKDPNKMFTRTKQLLIDVINCVPGKKVSDMATCPTLAPQEQKYRAIMSTRSAQQQQAKLNNTTLNNNSPMPIDNNRVSLHEVKTRLSHNLRRLETQGQATKTDNYQSLLTSIGNDIINQKQIRMSRKTELQRHLLTARQLEEKEKFYKEQMQSYQTYLSTCLGNIAARNKNVHAAISDKKNKSKNIIKCTAIKLKEKGVLLEIEELPDVQLKNVLFEISPLAQTGVFHVQVKFMGVAMELVTVDIQELLQLQYEGVTVSNMFRKVKVNVNLLIHLLNAKFYKKKK